MIPERFKWIFVPLTPSAPYKDLTEARMSAFMTGSKTPQPPTRSRHRPGSPRQLAPTPATHFTSLKSATVFAVMLTYANQSLEFVSIKTIVDRLNNFRRTGNSVEGFAAVRQSAETLRLTMYA